MTIITTCFDIYVFINQINYRVEALINWLSTYLLANFVFIN